jgi:small GTP-binding protein
MQNRREVKVVFLGDVAVGKSTVAYRIQSGAFVTNLSPTIAAGYICIGRENVKLSIWDSSGSERFNRLLPMYVRGSKIIVLTYDVTRPCTVEKIIEYHARFVEEVPDTAQATWMVIGNKSDIPKNHVEVQAVKEALQFANKEKLQHFLVSAHSGENIDKLLESLFLAAQLSAPTTEQDSKIVHLENSIDNNKSKWFSCC